MNSMAGICQCSLHTPWSFPAVLMVTLFMVTLFMVQAYAGTTQGVLSGLPQEDTIYDCSRIPNLDKRLFIVTFNSSMASLTLRNTTFQNCPYGALAVASDQAVQDGAYTLELVACRFFNNTIPVPKAWEDGGAALSVVGEYDSGGGGYDSRSPGLKFFGSSLALVMTDCEFVGNGYLDGVYDDVGAAVHLLSIPNGVQLTMTRTKFVSNWGLGPALYSRWAPLALDMIQCEFRNNGAGVVLQTSNPGSYIDDDGSLFIDNGARYGAVTVAANQLSGTSRRFNTGLYFSNTRFVNNTALAGGAIHVESSTSNELRLWSCTLEGNTALNPNYLESFGGAIFANNYRTMLFNTTLRNNAAKEGGALWADGQFENRIDNNCTLEGNSAEGYGGAVVLGAKASILITGNTVFTRNRAGLGGALACKQCAGIRTHYDSVNNIDFPARFEHNSARSAGAIALICPTGRSDLEQGTVLYNNSAVVRSANMSKDCVLGSDGLGGAICVSLQEPSAGLLLDSNVLFDSNSATTGGALFASGPCFGFTSGKAAISIPAGTSFDNNAALGGAGGAIFVADRSWLQIDCATGSGTRPAYYCAEWHGNTATGYGNVTATRAAGIAPVLPVVPHVSGELVGGAAVQLVDGLGQNVTAGTYDADTVVVVAELLTPNATNAAGNADNATADASGSDVGTTASAPASGNGTSSSTASSPNPTSAAGSSAILSGATLNVSYGGAARLTQVVLAAQPGTYTLAFKTMTLVSQEDPGAADEEGATPVSNTTTVTIMVQPGCIVGSIVNSNGFVCAPCGDSPPTYSFNPLNATCDACPRGAACSVPEAPAAQLVPLDGFWHSSPLSPQIHRCPSQEACKFANRTAIIARYQAILTGEGKVVWMLPPPPKRQNTTTANCSADSGNAGDATGGDCSVNASMGDAAARRRLLQAAADEAGNATSGIFDVNAYWALQCAPGYGGVMCSICAPGYGHTTNGCSRCPASGLNTLYYVLSYSITVLLLVITIRAQVAEAVDAPGAADNVSGLQQLQEEDGTSTDGSEAHMRQAKDAWQAKVEPQGDGHQPGERLKGGNQQTAAGGQAGPGSEGEGAGADEGVDAEVEVRDCGGPDEPMRDISVMKVIIKIFVNYLQVSSVLRQVDLVYPAAVIKLFDIGSQISSAVGRLVSLDCSLPDGMSKAAQRTVINILLPVVCLLLALPLWVAVHALQGWLVRRDARKAAEEKAAASDQQQLGEGKDEGEGAGEVAPLGAYLPRRMVISAIAITFFFYPSVTNELLSLLSCSRLDEQGGAYGEYAAAVGLFWDSDCGVRCFSGLHAGLVWGLAVPGLLLFSVGVPLASALWLWRAARRRLLGAPSFASRYAFLYSDYAREAWYWWESAIMLRKLAVVAVAVATTSRPLVVQIHCLLAVVLLAGLAHLLARPYACALFNRLEAISLGATVLSLWLCYFFMLQASEISYGARVALSVCLFATNIGVLLYFLHCLLLEVWRYAVWALDKDGDGQVQNAEVRAYLKDTLGGPLAALAAALAPSSAEQRYVSRAGDKRGSSFTKPGQVMPLDDSPHAAPSSAKPRMPPSLPPCPPPGAEPAGAKASGAAQRPSLMGNSVDDGAVRKGSPQAVQRWPQEPPLRQRDASPQPRPPSSSRGSFHGGKVVPEPDSARTAPLPLQLQLQRPAGSAGQQQQQQQQQAGGVRSTRTSATVVGGMDDDDEFQLFYD